MRKTHLLYIIALSVMLSATMAGSVILSQAATNRTACVSFSPSSYTLGSTPPSSWKVSISVGFYTWKIVASSIKLQGSLSPTKTSNCWFSYYAYFSGSAVVAILQALLGHVAGGCYKVSLTVSGKCSDGSTFSGTGTISVTVPSTPPP